MRKCRLVLNIATCNDSDESLDEGRNQGLGICCVHPKLHLHRRNPFRAIERGTGEDGQSGTATVVGHISVGGAAHATLHC